MLQRAITTFTLIGAVIGLDQFTKALAVRSLSQGAVISTLGDIVRFEYAENAGAFLSLGHSLSPVTRAWLFVGFTGAVLLIALTHVLLERSLTPLQLLAASLMMGGGASNLIDRSVRDEGKVIDFLNLRLGSMQTGIFNIADVTILLGVALLGYAALIGYAKLETAEDEARSAPFAG